MKSVDNFRMLRFYKGADNQSAIVTQFNGRIRVLDADNKEMFFHELTTAVKYLIDDGYCMEYLFKTCYKYPEENRVK